MKLHKYFKKHKNKNDKTIIFIMNIIFNLTFILLYFHFRNSSQDRGLKSTWKRPILSLFSSTAASLISIRVSTFRRGESKDNRLRKKA